jgi:aldehyde dehydrogenase (NAD+)
MNERVQTQVSRAEAYSHWIDGRAQESADGQRLDVLCPSDGLVFATISRGGDQDVDRAVRSARRAFEDGHWRKLSAQERGKILMRFSALVADRAEQLAAIEARDVGKVMKSTRFDVATLARYLEFYGAAVDKLLGSTIPSVVGVTALTLHEPHGVVGAILPWNSPTQMFGRVVSPALAMGNSVVIKPAEDACLSVIKLAAWAEEAGVPSGVLNVVTGLGVEAGAALSAHPEVDFISFTGSPEVGVLVQKAAATIMRASLLNSVASRRRSFSRTRTSRRRRPSSSARSSSIAARPALQAAAFLSNGLQSSASQRFSPTGFSASWQGSMRANTILGRSSTPSSIDA